MLNDKLTYREALTPQGIEENRAPFYNTLMSYEKLAFPNPPLKKFLDPPTAPIYKHMIMNKIPHLYPFLKYLLLRISVTF